MSAANVSIAAVPRQVTCQTLGNDHIPVDLDVLLLSRLFKKMYDDLGLAEHDAFPGVFPVENVSSPIFKKVVDWCTEHIDEPEPVIEKDPLTQECKWFKFTDYDNTFFDVPMPELLELVMAANYLDIARLYHYACQAVAARIKGKHPREICQVLQQDCDHDLARINEIYAENPWLPAVFSEARIRNPLFIPNEVLLTIFEKLPRADLERLQLVSTNFDALIVYSVKLSEQQGPLRVVTRLEIVAHGRFPQGIDVWLHDGTVVTCPDYKDLAKRLRFATVEKLRIAYGGMRDADIRDLCALLPVKSVWRNATVEVSLSCFKSNAPLKFYFTRLLLCKEIILDEEQGWHSWSPAWMRLPAIAECNRLDITEIAGNLRLQQADVVDWLEHELPPEKKWSEPRQMILDEDGIVDADIDGLLTALKTAFSASISPKSYVARILWRFHRGYVNEVLVNEKTHEQLIIRTGQNKDLFVERA